jgi:hypothetical protein
MSKNIRINFFSAFATILFFGISPQLFSLKASATLTLVSYPQYVYTLDDTDKTNIILNSGMTGTSCTGSGSATCNSCSNISTFTSGVEHVCNNYQIYPDLKFVVVLKTDNASGFTASTKISMKKSAGSVVRTSQNSQGTITANQEVTAEFLWRDICALSTGDSDDSCTDSFRTVIEVGFDKDGSGAFTESQKFTIAHRYVKSMPASFEYQSLGCADTNNKPAFCNFYVYPGDEKVFVTADNSSVGSFSAPNLSALAPAPPLSADPSGQKYASLRIYYAQGGNFNSLTPNSDFYDLIFDPSGGSLKDAKLEGLTNDQQYIFMMASVDDGGNVTHFYNDTLAVKSCPSDGTSICNDPSATYYANGRSLTQSAIPRTVYGLLDKTKCFVATAAFGSPMDQNVELLRNFRDQYLMSFDWGRKFVKSYYQWGPKAAQVLVENPTLRWGVRQALWPIVGFAYLVLHFGIWSAFAILIVAFGLLGATCFYVRNRKLKISKALS